MSHTRLPIEEPPLDLHKLSFAGKLLVWSGRQWVFQQSDWSLVETEFAGPLGAETGRDLAAALESLYSLLNVAAYRPIVFGDVQCREIARDEALIVRLVEMEQRHLSEQTMALLNRLLPWSEARRAIAVVARIAQLLEGAGYKVSVSVSSERPARLPAAAPAPRKRLLH